MRRELTQDVLKIALTYNSLSGVFTRNLTTGNRALKGSIAGTRDVNGYGVIRLNTLRYTSTSLAWLYMTGEHTDSLIDHIDGNPYNDRWDNLRKANHVTNAYNSKIRTDNNTGVKGLTLSREGHFVARITINKVPLYIGTYKLKEDASKQIEQYREFHHKDFANNGEHICQRQIQI